MTAPIRATCSLGADEAPGAAGTDGRVADSVSAWSLVDRPADAAARAACPVPVDFPWATSATELPPRARIGDRRRWREWTALARAWGAIPYTRPRTEAERDDRRTSLRALRAQMGKRIWMAPLGGIFGMVGGIALIALLVCGVSWAIVLPEAVATVLAWTALVLGATADGIDDALLDRLRELNECAPTPEDIQAVRAVTDTSAPAAAVWDEVMAHAHRTGVPMLAGDIAVFMGLRGSVSNLTSWASVRKTGAPR